MSDVAPRSFIRTARVVRFVTWAYLWIAALGYIASILALALDITLRYGFNNSVTGLHEAVVVVFIYVYMLGAAAMYARNEDVAMAFFFDRLPERWKAWAALLIYALVTVTMSIVFWQTLVLNYSQLHIPTPALGLSTTLQSVPLTILSASVILTSLIEIWACAIWISSAERPSIWPSLKPEPSQQTEGGSL